MRVRQRVRVNLKTHRTIEGVIVSKRGKYLQLADCLVENEHGKLMRAAGVVFIAKCDVEFIQIGWVQ